MKNKMAIGSIILTVLLLATGIVGYQMVTAPKREPVPSAEEKVAQTLVPVDASIVVTAAKSRTKDNTVVLNVSGLGNDYASVAYELTYDSQGLIKGVNSGSKPIDVSGKDTFEREVYLGTCSRNVCKPDLGVKKVSLVLEFTNVSGKKSQFSQDFEL